MKVSLLSREADSRVPSVLLQLPSALVPELGLSSALGSNQPGGESATLRFRQDGLLFQPIHHPRSVFRTGRVSKRCEPVPAIVLHSCTGCSNRSAWLRVPAFRYARFSSQTGVSQPPVPLPRAVLAPPRAEFRLLSFLRARGRNPTLVSKPHARIPR